MPVVRSTLPNNCDCPECKKIIEDDAVLLDSQNQMIPSTLWTNNVYYSWMGLTKPEYDAYQSWLRYDEPKKDELKVIHGKRLIKELWIYERLFEKTDKTLMMFHFVISGLISITEELERKLKAAEKK